MNLLVFLDRRYPSDHAFIEEVYARFLPARGHRVVLVMAADPGSVPERAACCWTEKWHEAEVLVFRAPRLDSLGGIAGRVRAVARLRSAVRKIVEQRRIGIVGVRNDLMLGMLAAGVAREKGLPLVFQLSHLKEEALQQYARSGLYHDRTLSWAKGRLGALVRDRVILRRAQAVLAVSSTMKEHLISKGFSPEKVFVVPLGAAPVNLAASAALAKARSALREQLGVAAGDPLLVYIGTLSRARNLEFLIDTLAGVHAGGRKAVLLVVGKEERSGDREALERYAAALGIREHCRFVSAVPRGEVPRYLVAADVGLSPFPREWILDMNSPMKLMECLAAGLPVVASDIPEQKSIIGASGGGYCVPYRADAFAGAVLKLLGDPEAARAMGERGRRYIEAERSYEAIGRTVEQIYLQAHG